jgi:hypothetical protein
MSSRRSGSAARSFIKADQVRAARDESEFGVYGVTATAFAGSSAFDSAKGCMAQLLPAAIRGKRFARGEL